MSPKERERSYRALPALTGAVDRPIRLRGPDPLIPVPQRRTPKGARHIRHYFNLHVCHSDLSSPPLISLMFRSPQEKQEHGHTSQCVKLIYPFDGICHALRHSFTVKCITEAATPWKTYREDTPSQESCSSLMVPTSSSRISSRVINPATIPRASTTTAWCIRRTWKLRS